MSDQKNICHYSVMCPTCVRRHLVFEVNGSHYNFTGHSILLSFPFAPHGLLNEVLKHACKQSVSNILITGIQKIGKGRTWFGT
jgi:hypothetical protein